MSRLQTFPEDVQIVGSRVSVQRQLGNVNFELRDIVTKAKHPAKFRPYDMVEHVRLEGRKFQCLYTEGEWVGGSPLVKLL